ncbi:hypothetical protein VNO77_18817 [Canavalia gladiata]|uniref:Uncharacterized protein n=1 Tax=Canavalia gladiata TaxID=3824 RepID=A0AAN9LLE2_CANGL
MELIDRVQKLGRNYAIEDWPSERSPQKDLNLGYRLRQGLGLFYPNSHVSSGNSMNQTVHTHDQQAYGSRNIGSTADVVVSTGFWILRTSQFVVEALSTGLASTTATKSKTRGTESCVGPSEVNLGKATYNYALAEMQQNMPLLRSQNLGLHVATGPILGYFPTPEQSSTYHA